MMDLISNNDQQLDIQQVLQKHVSTDTDSAICWDVRLPPLIGTALKGLCEKKLLKKQFSPE